MVYFNTFAAYNFGILLLVILNYKVIMFLTWVDTFIIWGWLVYKLNFYDAGFDH